MPAPKGNKYWMLRTDHGRPADYTDAEEFAVLVEEYFTECEKEQRRPTLAGVSLHLGFADRDTFTTYKNKGEDFARTVKKARMIIEDDRWQQLLDKDRFTPGVIFDMKNNHGWKDKQEVDHKFGILKDVSGVDIVAGDGTSSD